MYPIRETTIILPFNSLGGTKFEEPPANAAAPGEDRFLGVRNLYWLFDVEKGRRGCDDCWGLALMEMLTDPMLRQWVPAWVIEQYERANPFYKEVLTALQGEEHMRKNRALLKQTRHEMIRRHRRYLKKRAAKAKEKAGDASSTEEESRGESDADSEADAEKQADDLAAKLAKKYAHFWG